ncbi:hypothetical protein SARC_17666, partial [Sphaeroforma arctica JP610]
AFTSSPGTVSSHDDFYMTSNRLAVIETTNGMYNDTYIRRNIRVESLMTFHRANVANMLAKSGRYPFGVWILGF